MNPITRLVIKIDQKITEFYLKNITHTITEALEKDQILTALEENEGDLKDIQIKEDKNKKGYWTIQAKER